MHNVVMQHYVLIPTILSTKQLKITVLIGPLTYVFKGHSLDCIVNMIFTPRKHRRFELET